VSGRILVDKGFNEFLDDAGNLTYLENTQIVIPSSTLTAYQQTFMDFDADGFPIMLKFIDDASPGCKVFTN
jgi:hypothetical protein